LYVPLAPSRAGSSCLKEFYLYEEPLRSNFELSEEFLNKEGEIYIVAEWEKLKDLELSGEAFEKWFVTEVLAGARDATNVNVYFV